MTRSVKDASPYTYKSSRRNMTTRRQHTVWRHYLEAWQNGETRAGTLRKRRANSSSYQSLESDG